MLTMEDFSNFYSWLIVGAGARHYTAILAVIPSSDATTALPPTDIVYVNAGATHPLDIWLAPSRVGGRLLLPLTLEEGFARILPVSRRGPDDFTAAAVIPAAFIPCIGVRDKAPSRSLAVALEIQFLEAVTPLHRHAANALSGLRTFPRN